MAMPATATAFVSTHAPVCKVHTCGRCKRGLPSVDPCSFVLAHTHQCQACQAQEQALKHLSLSRSVWGASLASLRRAA